jgi:hypothetical protein
MCGTFFDGENVGRDYKFGSANNVQEVLQTTRTGTGSVVYLGRERVDAKIEADPDL